MTFCDDSARLHCELPLRRRTATMITAARPKVQLELAADVHVQRGKRRGGGNPDDALGLCRGSATRSSTPTCAEPEPAFPRLPAQVDGEFGEVVRRAITIAVQGGDKRQPEDVEMTRRSNGRARSRGRVEDEGPQALRCTLRSGFWGISGSCGISEGVFGRMDVRRGFRVRAVKWSDPRARSPFDISGC